MGINPTQSNFKSFTFDGTNSRAYGVYITGEGVFNAPERNVEMVDIPGRNGAFALDKGNFNNIEVTYPAGIFADTEADFAQAVSELRNLLCSKVGYVRLEDDYNPNEYRLAIYKSGLEVDHDFLIAGEFELVFECKPQRYLKSGETAISVTSGNTITNPTRFDAQPQFQVRGYGNIDINGTPLVVENVQIGELNMSGAKSGTEPFYQYLRTSGMGNGDTITFMGKQCIVTFDRGINQNPVTAFSVTSTSNCSATVTTFGSYQCVLTVTIPQCTFAYRTNRTEESTVTISYTINGTTKTSTLKLQTVYSSAQFAHIHIDGTSDFVVTVKTNAGEVHGYSTQTISNTIYIDFEIGEVWIIDGGEIVQLNNSVQIPAELPTLPSGSNTITYDNTFTSFKVVPRWWQV